VAVAVAAVGAVAAVAEQSIDQSRAEQRKRRRRSRMMVMMMMMRRRRRSAASRAAASHQWPLPYLKHRSCGGVWAWEVAAKVVRKTRGLPMLIAVESEELLVATQTCCEPPKERHVSNRLTALLENILELVVQSGTLSMLL